MSNLNLIDWRLVFFSSLWLVGLSLILSALSFADYVANQAHQSLKQILTRPSYQFVLHIGGCLFAMGMTNSSQSWWEAILWAILALGFGYQAWQAARRAARNDADEA